MTRASCRTRIFVRSYNRRDYLQAAVDSILAQTCDDYDIVIIDDASTDGAGDIARAYERAHPDRIRAVVKPARRGPSDSIEMSLGMLGESEYAAFVDDDDLWHPKKLERQLAELDGRPSLGLVATDAVVVDEDGRPTGQRFSDLFAVPRTEDLASALFDANFLCASSVLVRSSALELVKEHYPGFGGGCFDMYMWIAVSAHTESLLLEAPLTSYRRSHDSMTTLRAEAMWRETHALRRYAFDRFPALRAKVGERAGEQRINGDALYRAMLNLRERRFREYCWFSAQVLRRWSVRWSGIWLWLTARAAAQMVRRPRP